MQGKVAIVSLVDISDILYFFSARGGGRGSPSGGGVSGGGGPEGAGRVSVPNWVFFLGGGPKFLFSGPKRPPS